MRRDITVSIEDMLDSIAKIESYTQAITTEEQFLHDSLETNCGNA